MDDDLSIYAVPPTDGDNPHQIPFGRFLSHAHADDRRLLPRRKCRCEYLWSKEVHASTQLFSSQSDVARLFWGIVILTALCLAIVNTVNMVREYSSQSTSTLITIVPQRELLLPTMIFCYKNPDTLNYTGIYTDMEQWVPGEGNTTKQGMAAYAIAGFGLGNVDLSMYDDAELQQIDFLVRQWRGNRSWLDLYNMMIVENGYTCEDMFYSCYDGGRQLNCCSVFHEEYLIVRGKCFRMSGYYQTDVDETSKIAVSLKTAPSPLIAHGSQPQAIIYISDEYQEVGFYPHYYLNDNQWNRLRFALHEINSLSSSNCSTDYITRGKSTCYVYRWFESIRHALNCTPPYGVTFPYNSDLPICDPYVVIANYDLVTNQQPNFNCPLACQRHDVEIQITSSIDLNRNNGGYAFYLEASYTEMQVEALTTTGFISQLGGQTTLFLGMSIISSLQLIALALQSLRGWLMRREAVADYVYRKLYLGI